MKHAPSLLAVLFFFSLFFWGNPAPAHAQNHNTRMQDLINRMVTRVEDRVERLLTRYCDRFTNYQEKYGSDLPTFCEEDIATPSPSPTPLPTPSSTITPSPSLSPSPEPSLSPTPTPTPSATSSPEPSPGPSTTPTTGLVISEVFYDVDDLHGTEGTNEWVELHNNSETPINVSNFALEDASSSDVLPDGTTIPAHGYLIITNNLSTTTFWSIPSETVALGASIGNGLGNGGDFLSLKNTNGIIVDSVSWGSDITAFDPSVDTVAAGSSMARQDKTIDTDTANDWTELTAPTPGQ